MKRFGLSAKQFSSLGWLLLATVILFVFVLYKFFELSVINSTVVRINNNWNKEFKLAEENQINSNDLTNKLNEATSSGKLETVEGLESVVEMLNVANNLNEGYLDELEANKKKIESNNKTLTLFLSRHVSLLKSILLNQLEYYKREISRTISTKIGIAFLKNAFRVQEDFIRQNDFDKKGQANLSFYTNNFHEVAFLKKYTDKDFLFEEEEEIKKNLPKGYEYLKNSKDYFSIYYSIVQDLAQQDYESAGYKYQALSDRAIDINFDINNIFAQSDKKYERISNEIIKLIVDYIELINRFEKKGFPLASPSENFDEDLIQCQLYAFKLSLYSNLLHKHPKSNNVKEFISELNQISPKTSDIDGTFDNSAMSLKNTNNKILITCRSKDGRSYRFETLK